MSSYLWQCSVYEALQSKRGLCSSTWHTSDLSLIGEKNLKVHSPCVFYPFTPFTPVHLKYLCIYMKSLSFVKLRKHKSTFRPQQYARNRRPLILVEYLKWNLYLYKDNLHLATSVPISSVCNLLCYNVQNMNWEFNEFFLEATEGNHEAMASDIL